MDSTVACPICTMTDILTTTGGGHECATCGHEWDGDAGDPTALGEIRDSNGTVLQNGDSVVVIKQLPLKGIESIKIGTKVTNIRLIAGDHEIDCKINGRGVLLKAKFVKKA
ncbi:MAG: alkylphosphonate utilization protein [Actinobacteria bacterium]|jgi:protein PhnA|nr:alkylphosphonate utilization protein [Actinomycetota bacterium]